jgi:hypothetical protein
MLRMKPKVRTSAMVKMSSAAISPPHCHLSSTPALPVVSPLLTSRQSWEAPPLQELRNPFPSSLTLALTLTLGKSSGKEFVEIAIHSTSEKQTVAGLVCRP